jgi:hypothetical protein
MAVNLPDFTTANSISFPNDGTKFYSALAGTYQLDFEQGTVTDPNGKSTPMSSSLMKLQEQFVKSLYVWVSTVAATIKIGNNILPQMQQNAFIISGIGFNTMSITFPGNRTPVNDFAFQVLATDSPVFPYDVSTLIGNYAPPALTGNAPDAYGVAKDVLALGFSSIVFQIFNTDPAHILDAEVQGSEDGQNWVTEQGYPLTIVAQAQDVFADQIKHAYYRVLLKNDTAGQAVPFIVATALMR